MSRPRLEEVPPRPPGGEGEDQAAAGHGDPHRQGVAVEIMRLLTLPQCGADAPSSPPTGETPAMPDFSDLPDLESPRDERLPACTLVDALYIAVQAGRGVLAAGISLPSLTPIILDAGDRARHRYPELAPLECQIAVALDVAEALSTPLPSAWGRLWLVASPRPSPRVPQ